jgi:folate-dependent tRNA-U54 methylase TrmFO/GidA
MRTVIIWEEFGERALCWFVVDGDKSHLDRAYINCTLTPERIADELNALVYSDDGDVLVEFINDFNEMPRDDVKIIACGILP